ncbi:hypothetical protein GP475_05565 [Corynebacterium poyangense]|uniref:Tetratricopeptide repeat protein n=1 Tax=Corynebacterium poyangense TaxID=2684405 RepID=A0A7H0SNP3_9CORY|nr:hypothetical protein [Corynebacterium poyangense]QNQ90168.1 hypothetical protein GP475_05565 [Corynebacterium poyangense]
MTDRSRNSAGSSRKKSPTSKPKGWKKGSEGRRFSGPKRNDQPHPRQRSEEGSRWDEDNSRSRTYRKVSSLQKNSEGHRSGSNSRDDDRAGRGGGGGRRHSSRGGAGRSQRGYQPRRPNFREERTQKHLNEPKIPADIHAQDLDPLVRQDLRVLSKDNADRVARHMVAAAVFMDEDPDLALKHARAAKDRGGRVAVTRETCGIAAYRAGAWKEALAELRAARRISGGPGLLAVMADCERGLGRPAKAIELADSPEAQQLDDDATTELAIVVAGARQDMGDYQAAVEILKHHNPGADRSPFEAARISYAYAHALQLIDDRQGARTWFEHCVALDEDGLTDAVDRLAALDDSDSGKRTR